MKNLRLAYVSGVLGYRSLFAWNTPSLFFTVLVLTPVLQIIFFALLGKSLDYGNDLFFVVGNALQGATAASVGGLVSVIADERRFGTLGNILLSPASRVAVFAGRIAPGVVIAIAVAALTSVLGFLVVGWPLDVGPSLAYLAVIVVAAFSGAALGLTLSAFGLIYRDIYQIAMAAQLVMLIITGANVAPDALPDWVQAIAQFSPLTHAIAGARILTASDATNAAFWGQLGAEMLVGLGWLAVGLVLMRVLERASKRGATLDLY